MQSVRIFFKCYSILCYLKKYVPIYFRINIGEKTWRDNFMKFDKSHLKMKRMKKKYCANLDYLLASYKKMGWEKKEEKSISGYFKNRFEKIKDTVQSIAELEKKSSE